jgi:bacteriophage HK97-gp10 putative tail-component
MKIAIQITGAEELARYLSVGAPDAIKSAISSTLASTAQEILSTTTALSPVRTGFLQHSIHVEKSDTSISADADADYASFVDEGTSRMQGRHFFTDPINRITADLDKRLQVAVDRALEHADKGV